MHVYITDTLRSDGKYFPVDVMKKKLKEEEMILKSLGNILVIKWKDKSNVRMTANAFVV